MLRTWLDRIERALMVVATLALVLMMLSISMDAAGRHLFNRPFQGNFEITSLYLMVILVFATLSYNHRHGTHVRLDLVSDRLAARWGRQYTRLIALICLPVFAVMAAITGVEAVSKFRQLESHMGAIPFPIYLSYVWVALGTLTLTLRMVLDIVWPEDPPRSSEAETDGEVAP